MAENKRVILVEDDDDFSFVMKLILKQGGFESFQVEDGNSALNKIEEVKPFAVISDVRLPDILGTELAKQIKTKFPNILVILLSAYSQAMAGDLLKDSGADHFLMKPVDKEKLFEILNNI